MADRHASHVWLYAFVDVLLVLTFVLASYAWLVLPQINPIAKDNPDSAKPPGQMMVCIYWQGHNDVDLWGGSPDDDKATGYSRKSGKTIDLVRDDLGVENAPHFECEFARSLPDGRWAYNIHGYSIKDPEVAVHAEIRLGDEFGYHLLLERDLTIKYKQERTIAQFQLRDGKVVPGSVNEVLVPLRSAGA
jgi:hypothetical protein